MSKFLINNPAWLQMAGVSQIKNNYVVVKPSTSLASLSIGGSGEISVQYTKGGENFVDTYTDPNNVLPGVMVALEVDPFSDILISGNLEFLLIINGSMNGMDVFTDSYDISKCKSLTTFVYGIQPADTESAKHLIPKSNYVKTFYLYGGAYPVIDTSMLPNLMDLHAMVSTHAQSWIINKTNALKLLSLENCGIESCDLSGLKLLSEIKLRSNTASLEELNIEGCVSLERIDISDTLLTEFSCESELVSTLKIGSSPIQTLDLSNLTLLTDLDISTIFATNELFSSIKTIRAIAVNESVANTIAELINESTTDNCSVYLRNGDEFNSVIADAATTKGWTVEYV